MPSCNPVEGNPNTSEMDSVVKICARVYALTSLRLTASIGRAWEHGCVKTCPDGIRKQFNNGGNHERGCTNRHFHVPTLRWLRCKASCNQLNQRYGRIAAEIYGIRQLKASSAAQPEGCSACFVLVFVRIVMGLCRKTEE